MRSGTNGSALQVKPTQTGGSFQKNGKGRQSKPPPSRGSVGFLVDPAPVTSEDPDDSSRRTSSSSLADILNPTEESPIVSKTVPAKEPMSKQPSPERTPETIILAMPLKSEAQNVDPPSSSYVQSDKTVDDATTNEVEMDVDIIGSVKEETPMEVDNPTPIPAVTENKPHPVDPTPSSPMDNSENTTTTAVANIPTPQDTNSPFPTHVPTPSKKRKFTPESSPDEPLTKAVPDSTISTTPTIQNQIAVEKPQPPKAVKKPKKAPIKRPQNAKKKTPQAPKRPTARKPKGKSPSIGIDEVQPDLTSLMM
jgi:hypothetical protein